MQHPACSHILFQAPSPKPKDRKAQLIRMRKTSCRDSPRRNPEEVLRIHYAIEKRQLCRSEIGKRSASIARERLPDSSSLARPRVISRYDTRTEGSEESATPCKAALQKSITSSKLLASSGERGGPRRNTEPEPTLGVKEEVLRRVGKKIDFVRLMTEEEEPGHKEALFKFDKFYEHCLRNINKCLNHYEKDPNKHRSKKYFELKIEGGILSKELLQIRHSLLQKRDREDKTREEDGFGIVGSNIDVKNIEKTHLMRNNEQIFRKKAKLSRRAEQEFSNPFLVKEMCGWEIGDKAEELLL